MAGQRKSLSWLFISFLSVFSAIAVYSPLTAAEQAPSVYIVKEGDTLWDISNRYFADPSTWPALWGKNKHIKDPQWIYPGQPLLLKEKSPVPDNPARSGHPARAVKISSPQPAELPPAAGLQAAAPAPEYLINRDQIDSCGYILSRAELAAKEKQEQWGSIIDAKETKISYSYPDLIYINRGKSQVSPGAQFTVFRPHDQDMILHPETGLEIGYQIQILGVIEVKEVFERTALAQIIRSFSEIHLNDRIRTYQRIPLPARNEPKEKIQGIVIAGEDGRINLATYNIVFLDQGKKQHIQAGDCFSIYRRDSIIDENFQSSEQRSETVNDIVGELMVLKAEDDTSTALITKSKDAITVGTRFSTLP
ncbi:MAG: LysM peptidoglycan-binding domain-containing protein [bacterium]